MSVSLNIGKDINGIATYALPINTIIERTILAANTSQNVTIPANCTQVLFSFSNGTDVWVDYVNSTATFPGSSFASSTAELNPVLRYGLIPGKTLAFISDTTSYVCVSFFP